MIGYELIASPTLYPGQTVTAGLSADLANASPVRVQLMIRVYGENDHLMTVYGPEAHLQPGAYHPFTWQIPATGGMPIASIGLELRSEQRADGCIYLDYLTWEGVPNVIFQRPANNGMLWRRAWVNGMDHYEPNWPEAYRVIQDEGTGLLIQGTRDWRDYQVSADITPHLAEAAGIGARVQGMRRYYGLLLAHPGKARLVKALDGERVLAETDFPWEFGRSYRLKLEVRGSHLRGWIDDVLRFDVTDTERVLEGGAVALICAEGRMGTEAISVRPP
jgi:hypothetical protein